MQAGDMVTYRHTYRGGYGYETRIPAVVVHVHRTRATIRVARVDTVAHSTYAADVHVSLARLQPRKATCEFENVLKAGTSYRKSEV